MKCECELGTLQFDTPEFFPGQLVPMEAQPMAMSSRGPDASPSAATSAQALEDVDGSSSPLTVQVLCSRKASQGGFKATRGHTHTH